MLGMRDAKYCNLKLLLIYLVLYGHWIEPQIYKSDILMQIYRFIYAFHMPLFAFISGLFLNNKENCRKQSKRSLRMYLFLQFVAVILGLSTPFTPYWHLWYLLSYAIWCESAYWFFRIPSKACILLIISVFIGCMAGYIPIIDRAFSLSRSIVFFPYFCAGLLLRPNREWNRLRAFGFLSLILAIAALWYFPIPTCFLYQAAAFDDVAFGAEKRLLSYLIGAALCLFFLTFVPSRRFGFTKLGADTMPAYILHAPIVLILRKLPLPWWLSPMICVLLLYFIFKLIQWRRALYGIYEGGGTWQHFKSYTSNMPQRFTDSC